MLKIFRQFILVVFLCVIAAAALAVDGWVQLNQPLHIGQPTTIELATGQHFASLLQQMQDRGMFDHPRQRLYLLLYARGRRSAGALRAGEYAVEPGITPIGLIGLLQSGHILLHELRLTEGWTFSQALQAIEAEPSLDHTLADRSRSAVMQAVGEPGRDPEGHFFPDTYRFAKYTTDAVILRKAAQAMDKLLAEEWALRAPGLPYENPDQALTMASLVEKETGQSSERARIAGVFVRRLRMGMRLQTDPSIIYGLGNAFEGNLHLQDLRNDGPYNTYTRSGLPPTPICLPGRDSLHAALHPEVGDALYFVSRGDGTHQFSATLEQHNAAVNQYQIKPHQR